MSHLYPDEGTYLVVAVTVNDSNGGVGVGTAHVTVNNVAPVVNLAPAAAINEGDTYNSSGSFADPGTDETWTATGVACSRWRSTPTRPSP